MKTRHLLRLLIIIIILAGTIYWLTRLSSFRLVQNPDSPMTNTEIKINFFFPMRQEDLTHRITITPEIPRTIIGYRVRWLSSTTALLSLTQSGFPQGQLMDIKISGAPTIIPFIKKSAGDKLRPRVPLRLISNANFEHIPSRGPVPIIFNTPVNPNIIESLSLPIHGRIIPLRFSSGNKLYTDYSSWQYYPDKPFIRGTTYRLVIKPGLRSMGGCELPKSEIITYTIAAAPRVIGSKPENGSTRVNLYRTIEITTDKPLYSASLKVTKSGRTNEVRGKTTTKGNRVIFEPSECFMPNQSYKVRLTGKSVEHEPMDEYTYNFITVDMGNRLWVEVNLGEKHTMTIYRGNKAIRTMLASGGKSSTPTPLGTFNTQDRGHSFWSPRFGEGATYWVRLVDQVLIHSIPRDHRWHVKEDEHEKLGLPASHGCVRLSEENAKWFFENIPGGTPVIIHK